MRQSDQSLLSHPICPLIATLLTTVTWAVPCTVAAATDDVFKPYANYSISYDDNVLGLSGAETAISLTGSSNTSDQSRAAQGGIQIDKTVGRQQFIADFSASNVKYDRYSILNYQGSNSRAQWNWRLGNHLDGNAKVTYVRTLASFDDYHSLVKRLSTERRQNVELRWRYHPRWQIRSALSHYDLSYSSAAQKASDRKENLTEIGLEYIAPAGSTVGIVKRHIRGAYPFPLAVNGGPTANDFEQNETLARVLWSPSSKTKFQLNGGYVVRNHRSLTTKDFTGLNARTALEWTVTGKTIVSANAWRELGIVDDLFTAYSVNKGISIGPRWTISSKLQTEAQLRYESRSFRPAQDVLKTARYGDRTYSAQASLSYSPSIHWVLQLALLHMRKDGDKRFASFQRNRSDFTLMYQF